MYTHDGAVTDASHTQVFSMDAYFFCLQSFSVYQLSFSTYAWRGQCDNLLTNWVYSSLFQYRMSLFTIAQFGRVFSPKKGFLGIIPRKVQWVLTLVLQLLFLPSLEFIASGVIIWLHITISWILTVVNLAFIRLVCRAMRALSAEHLLLNPN